MTIIQLFKNLLPFVKPYRGLIYLTFILTVIGSFAAQVNAFVLRYTVDSISTLMVQHKSLNEGLSLILYISLILFVKEIINAIVQFGQKFYGEKIRIYISRDLAQTIVEKILTYKLAFYTASDNESGKLQTRIDLGISSLTRLVQNFFIDILPLFANAIVALGVMFYTNFYIGLVGLFMIPLYFFVSNLQATKLSGFRRSMRTYRETKSSRIINLIDSITVIKSFVNEKVEAEKHQKIQFDMTENQMKTRKTSFVFDSVKSFIEQFGVIIIIILTAYFVLQNQMTLGAIMFHIMLFSNVSAPIKQLHRIYDEVNDALIYSEGFFDILNASHENENTGSYQPETIKGLFKIENVNFAYPNGHQALHNISITIKPNEITALVGLSGAGKSTLINLLDKFYEPSKGTIYLDGIDIQNYDTHFLRKNIGLVLQKNHIFKGTILENIAYGKQDASQEEIIDAAQKAYIQEQILELPLGYESDANLLSGGQQQRIAIARLFLKDPPIIFLDEPTANLDAIATEQIKKSIDAIKKNRTVIIISHSISQIIDASTIVVLKHGEVIETGKHEELYKNKSEYYTIFNAMANSLNIEKIMDSFE